MILDKKLNRYELLSGLNKSIFEVVNVIKGDIKTVEKDLKMIKNKNREIVVCVLVGRDIKI